MKFLFLFLDGVGLGPDRPETNPFARAHLPRLDALLEGRVVRPRYGRHPRLFIWGLLEARLQHADRIILGGLNEGNWPPQAAEDPWLSRPMRKGLGLSSPERRLGQTHAPDTPSCLR